MNVTPSRVLIIDDDEAVTQTFAKMPRSRVSLEVGTHSAWVSRLLAG